jgi:hypothetical protein
MAGQYIDRDKLRAAIRKMGTEYVFLMLDDAITPSTGKEAPQADCTVPESGRVSSRQRQKGRPSR